MITLRSWGVVPKAKALYEGYLDFPYVRATFFTEKKSLISTLRGHFNSCHWFAIFVLSRTERSEKCELSFVSGLATFERAQHSSHVVPIAFALFIMILGNGSVGCMGFSMTEICKALH